MVQLATTKKSYNEQEFYDFLETPESTDVFFLIEENEPHGFTNTTTLVKVYSPDKEKVLLFQANYDLRGLPQSDLESLGDKIENVAIYYRKLKVMITNSTYRFDTAIAVTKKFRVISKGKLYEEIGIAIENNYEAKKHLLVSTYLKEGKQPNKEMRERYERDDYSNFIRGTHYKYSFITRFIDEVQSLRKYQEYLTDPNQFVENFVNDKISTNPESFDDAIRREVSYIRTTEKLEKDKVATKIRGIYNLLSKDELKDAKKVWVTLNDGTRHQVDNQIWVDGPYSDIGFYSNKKHLSDITLIEYSRKTYEVN